MLYSLPKIMMICLVTTIFIESSIAFLFKVKEKEDFLLILLVNCLTNPLVVTIPYSININHGIFYRNTTLYTLEIITFLVEGYMYKKYLNYTKINGYVLSFLLNISSFLLGNVINYFLY